MCRLKYIHINLYMYGLTCVPRGPTILMHLAAPESLMKRTQNHCQQRYLTNICVPYISYYVDILCLYVPYTSYINLGYFIYTLYLLLCRNLEGLEMSVFKMRSLVKSTWSGGDMGCIRWPLWGIQRTRVSLGAMIWPTYVDYSVWS
jgi:hypothetical protein